MRRVPLNRRRWKRQTGVWNLNSKTNSVDLTHSWMVNTEDTNSQSSSCIGMDSVQIWKAALYCREARVRVVVCNFPTRLLSLCCTVWLASPIVAQISAYCIHLSMGGWMDGCNRQRFVVCSVLQFEIDRHSTFNFRVRGVSDYTEKFPLSWAV